MDNCRIEMLDHGGWCVLESDLSKMAAYNAYMEHVERTPNRTFRLVRAKVLAQHPLDTKEAG